MAHGSILGQKLEDALLVDGSKSMQANLNMNNHKVTNVTNGTASADAVNYSQLQTKLSLSGGTMTGPINMGNNKITNVANGVADTDAATVGQLNAAVANVGPQYTHPTGNRHFDFCGLFVILQSNISSSTTIDSRESGCFTIAYKYIYGSPSIGDEMVLLHSGSSAFRVVYKTFGWELSMIDKASRGEVFWIAGRVV